VVVVVVVGVPLLLAVLTLDDFMQACRHVLTWDMGVRRTLSW
jgi:hypothetical protein